MRKKVAILGGGIAGLSAAHELADHFDVHVYEQRSELGGKACSQFKSKTGQSGRRDLPGEHGFRFFPAFYKHIIDTMRRTPTEDGGNVAMNLIACNEMALAEKGHDPYTLLRHRPRNIGEFFRVVDIIEEFFQGLQIESSDVARFGAKMLSYLCSCQARRLGQYEKISFWRYIEGHRYTPRFQNYINSSRFMVAMDARHGNARTLGDKAIQLLLDFCRAEDTNDRVLNGPTTTQWLEPWETYLRQKGVRFLFGQTLQEFDVDGTVITGARIQGSPTPIQADYYVLALPLERVNDCIGSHLAALDPSLKRLKDAPDMTDWMVGAQFYLREDVPICDGHVAYPDAPWALSSISQTQFWQRTGMMVHQTYGDGQIKGILSVDISDWNRPGSHIPKTAAQCSSKEEVLTEVWKQLQDSLNSVSPILTDDNRLDWHLDDNIVFEGGKAINKTPLLVHPPGSWAVRPEATTSIANLMLASDYVRTTTDLATMEGANEAARLAVNAIFEREGMKIRAKLWPMEEEAGWLVKLAKKIDQRKWDNHEDVTFGDLGSQPDLTLEQVKNEQEILIDSLRHVAKIGTGQ